MASERLRERLQRALGKEYTVGELLGEGGFAVVFRARDNALAREVAVKVLDLRVAPSPTLAERFVREAQTVARLEHPNIVPIYKVGGHGKLLYIIMRYVDGPSLRAVLSGPSRVPVDQAAGIAGHVADALAYAHDRGIVHRDIKPDNILLDQAGHVFVTDFGIAKAAEEAKSGTGPLTTEGMILGTPQYMSPEQAAGDRLDGRSDIYSLGVVLYHMLAGEPPFDGDSAQSVLVKQLTEPPAPIRRFRGEVSGELAGVLNRMLEKGRDRRPATATEVSRALAAVPKRSTEEVTPLVGSRVARGHRAPFLARMASGCLSLAVLVAAGVAVYWGAVSDPPRLNVGAPVPAAVADELRQLGALAGGETAEYVFAPTQGGDTTVLVLTRGRVVVARRSGVRRYPRDSVGYHVAVALRRGVSAALLLVRSGAPADTVYPRLSVRAAVELAWGLRDRLPSDPVRGRGLNLGPDPRHWLQ